jgi:NitT/TauT family transport system substrate-binding protein
LKPLEYRREYELIAAEKSLARVVIDSSTGGIELIRKLAEDQFDLSFGGVPAMLLLIDQGSPIKILSPANFEGAGLILREDLPIDDWDGFLAYLREHRKPLRIGYKIAMSVQNLIFEQALDASGIRYSETLADDSVDIILVNLYGPKNLIPALQNGLIDGFVVNQPFLAQARYQGVGKLVARLSELPPEGKWRNYPCCAVAARGLFIDSHPEIASALFELLQHANRFIGEHPEQSAAQIAEWLGTPLEVETDSLSSMSFSAEMDARWENGVNTWVETMIDRYFLKGRVRDAHDQGELSELLYPRSGEEALD